MMRALSLVAILLIWLVIVSAANAVPQSAYSGVLTGVVLDESGKPAVNAIVTYQSGGGDTPHAVHTDARGHFTISKLARDNYDLRASSHGMSSSWQKNVMVRAGQEKSVTLRLQSDSQMIRTTLQTPKK
ncbi:MAG TPA: carboxypeptidase-like regulatory domain-containing protein [Candidatus Acidoferrum sp.]|jgi:hypothetical protein